MLQICTACAVLGIALVSAFPSLTGSMLLATVVASVVCLGLRSRFPRRRIDPLLCVLLGMLCAEIQGLQLLRAQLPAELEQVPLTIHGTVIGLPESMRRQGVQSSRFEFRVDTVQCGRDGENCARGLGLLRLTWREAPSLLPGQRWQLQVRLKRPRGYMNPGGFDYQTWLVARGFGATGYVVDGSGNRLLAVDRGSLAYWRGQLATVLDGQLQHLEQAPLLKALLIADKRDLKRRQWQRFQRHGVIHLLVISGLHIGLVASLVFALSRLLALLTPWRYRATELAALAAVCAALLYCLAAGATLPTRRAVIATAVVMACIAWRREGWARLALPLSLLACLLTQPLAIVSPSFWLSFAAVALLIIGLSGRIGPSGFFRLLLKSQWVIALGMTPVMLATLGQISWVAPLVNLLAVPLFSLVVVPSALTGLVMLPVMPLVSALCWQLCEFCLNALLAFLLRLEQALPLIYSHLPQLPLPVLASLAVAAVILVAPRGFPGKPMAAVTLIGMLLYQPPPPPPGDLSLTVLDVGQGLSVVVQTHAKTLVYDLGPRYELDEGEFFSTAQAVVLPFLRSRGIAAVDTLVLSHADNDHAGGWQTFLADMPVARVLVGEPIPQLPASRCSRDEHWEWSGVQFRFLQVGPVDDGLDRESPAFQTSNNLSCVLQIEVAGQRILLPGDIETEIEWELVRDWAEQLAATVLVAPHHGSRSSSSWALVKHVRPRHVVFSAGYRNAFNHPSAVVQQRYQRIGSVLHNTSEHGAVEFRFSRGRMLSPTHYRPLRRRFWL